jgi:D-xylonolactonase
VEPRIIADFQCETGEGPLWHPDERRLYWVDIPRGRLLRWDPATGHSEAFDVGAAVGGFTIQADGALLLFMAKGAVTLWRGGAIVDTVLDSLPDELDNRFNDVIADPAGRVFCGTMSAPSHPGRLYRLNLDGTVTQLLDGIGTSNGLGFTPDHTGLYFTDTGARTIYLFDYDARTGDIANRRVFVHVLDEGDNGRPDGMTVDAEGCVWSAMWDGARVVRYSPEGRELMRLAFPAPKTSCVTFGGDDCTDMFVTTAGGHIRDRDGPHAGALFHVDAGIAGVPEFQSRIGSHFRPLHGTC